MVLQTLEDVQALLQRCRPDKLTLGFPMEVRLQVGAWLQQQHQQGSPWAALSGQLGLSSTTLADWARLYHHHKHTESPAAFLPIQIKTQTNPPPSSLRPIVLCSPNGYRVEGLNPSQLLDLLRSLG